MKKLLVILLLLFPVHGAWSEAFVSIGKYSLGEKITKTLSLQEIKKYKELPDRYNYSRFYLHEFNKKVDILEFKNNDTDTNYDQFQIYYDKNSLKIEKIYALVFKPSFTKSHPDKNDLASCLKYKKNTITYLNTIYNLDSMHSELETKIWPNNEGIVESVFYVDGNYSYGFSCYMWYNNKFTDNFRVSVSSERFEQFMAENMKE